MNNNRNNNNLDARQYDEEFELAQALSLSAESFAREQKQRKEEEEKQKEKYLALVRAKELEERARKEREEREKNDPRFLACKNTEMLLNSMKWSQMFINRGIGAGLQNLGNSCFLNATLQCLAYTAPFAQILHYANHRRICPSKRFCTLCELEAFIPSMLMNGRKIHSPLNLFRNLAKINDLLTPGCQEDAHEFLQSILDKMEMAYDDAYYFANNKDKRFKKDPFNPIRQLFVGTTKTTVMCSKCRTVTSTEEPFSCVSLDVDSDVTLTESLSIFTHDELLRGNEKYYCEQCKRKVIARKQLTLAKLPPSLIFHFKRFKAEAYSPHHKELSMKKLCDHVEFPSEIDFNENVDLIIHPSHQKDVSMDSIYELYGIVVHSGPKLGYGHYYAFIKSFDGKQWFRMNDMEVLPVDIKKVLKEQAYLMFYRRKTHNIIRNEINQLKVELMIEKNKNNPNNVNINNNDDNNNNNEQKQGCNVSENENKNDNNNGNKMELDENGKPKYRWQHERASPTQIRSIATDFVNDEKVDVNFLNDTYFESSCANLTKNNNNNNNNNNNKKNENEHGVIAMSDTFGTSMSPQQGPSGLSVDKSGSSNNSSDDRSRFVMVPPMTTRSDVSQFEAETPENEENDANASKGNNQNGRDAHDRARMAKMVSNAFEEVYWPGEEDDMQNID